MNEPSFDQQLSLWEIDVPDDPRFHSAVWREIAMRDANSLRDRMQSFLAKLTTPAFAIPMGAAAVVITVALAAFHGQESRAKTWNDLATNYSTAIDPIISHSISLSDSTE